MTELFIDGKPVTLPVSLDLKVKQQNPLITKNGTFTLDIELSLQERNNAILYQHIDRLQSSLTIQNRKALLIADGRIVINGTEAIISNTNEDIRIQLLSGNSELNYFIGSDIYVSDLDLGQSPELTVDNFEDALFLKYPEVGFAPAEIKVGSIRYNWRITRNGVLTYDNRRIQPYLLEMLARIISGLGYTISENELLEDEAACSIFFLNDTNTRDYNKMLPGWTALDFIQECETFFNIIFDINEFDRTVRIIKRASGKPLGRITINSVLDSYEREFVDENIEINYKNVKYDFSSLSWYKYQDIDDEVMEKAEMINFDTYTELTTFLRKNSDNHNEEVAPNYYKTLHLFYCKDIDTYFMVDYYYDKGWSFNPEKWTYLRPVNRFRKYQTTEDDDFVTLKFIPSQMTHHQSVSTVRAIPCHSDSDDPEDDKEITDITEYIENGIGSFNANRRTVCLAYHKPEYYQDHYRGSVIDWIHDGPYSNRSINQDGCTFRLDGQHGLHARYYSINDQYDTTKEYTIKFITDTMLDVRKEFLFNNKLFICKELEYRLTHEGIHPEVTGTFYEVK